jgi:hypothetical protein
MRGAVTVAAIALSAWMLASGSGGGGDDAARPDPGHHARVALPPRPIGAVHAAPIVGHVAEVADELVISPRSSSASGADDAAAAIADAGGEVAWRAPSGLLLARFATPGDAHQARAMLAADPRVRGVYTNHVMSGAGIATSPGLQQKWMLHAMQLTPFAQPAHGITVAVLDSGAAYESYSDASGTYAQAPDLAATPFAAGYDFVNNDAHPDDDHGHGTHITNIIAASATIVPMAPQATIMPIKVLDAQNMGTELALAEGIRYAVDHGAHVINMSLAFPPGYFPSRFLQDAIDYAEAQNVVMVAAAGNQAGDQVTYPAAFRNVIAVGASRLVPFYHPPRWAPWLHDELFLTRAEYSNRGNKVDLAAPAGSMNGDADGDGLPEAVVAQTFAPGQPTQFQYRLWAGTSQAAAQVSGIAAGMLGANGALSARQVRAILGESARPELGFLALSPDVGRGYLRADEAAAAAANEAGDNRTHYAVALRLGIATSPGHSAPVADATVEVLDSAGNPVPHVFVYGSFSGAATSSAVLRTDRNGQAVFISPSLSTPHVVGFEVDAVTDRLFRPRTFDRPNGAIRIDSCSLELLSTWAFAQGIATSPGMSSSGAGIATSPGNSIVNGEGIATSPSGQGIATSPGAQAAADGIATSPIALRVPRLPGEIDFVDLLDYSWSGSTLPMAVAVDTAWFTQTYPNAAIVVSSGAGIATSPITLNAATSFGSPVPPPTDATGCTPVIVSTFVPGDVAAGVSPVMPDPAQCGSTQTCAAQTTAVSDIWSWAATGQGIATSPGFRSSSMLSQAAWNETVASLWAWSQFAMNEPASPVSEFGAVLEAAGIATSPGAQSTAADDPNSSMPLP